MTLFFLRPSPPPSATYIRTFFRTIANVRTPGSRASGGGPARHSKPAARTIPKASPPPNSTASISSPETPSVAPTILEQLEPLPYHVGRTPSQQLPIYHLAKRGGNLHQTVLKKIQGDVDALKQELEDHLRLEKKHITINRLNGQIIIKGWLRSEIATFLREKHF